MIQSSLQRVMHCTEKTDYSFATVLMQVVTRLLMGFLGEYDFVN